MLKLNCPNCDKSLKADARHSGRRVNCPRCNHEFTVPQSSDGPPADAYLLSHPENPDDGIEQWLDNHRSELRELDALRFGTEKQRNEGVKLAHRLVQESPDDIIPYVRTSIFLREMGQIELARKLICKGMRKCRARRHLYEQMGELAIAEGNLGEAVSWFIQSYVAAKHVAQTCSNQVILYLRFFGNLVGNPKATVLPCSTVFSDEYEQKLHRMYDDATKADRTCVENFMRRFGGERSSSHPHHVSRPEPAQKPPIATRPASPPSLAPPLNKQVPCPNCHGQVLFDDKLAGSSVLCPHCSRQFEMANLTPATAAKSTAKSPPGFLARLEQEHEPTQPSDIATGSWKGQAGRNRPSTEPKSTPLSEELKKKIYAELVTMATTRSLNCAREDEGVSNTAETHGRSVNLFQAVVGSFEQNFDRMLDESYAEIGGKYGLSTAVMKDIYNEGQKKDWEQRYSPPKKTKTPGWLETLLNAKARRKRTEIDGLFYCVKCGKRRARNLDECTPCREKNYRKQEEILNRRMNQLMTSGYSAPVFDSDEPATRHCKWCGVSLPSVANRCDRCHGSLADV